MALTGCATVFTGTRQDVRFESQPPSTAIVLSGAPAALLSKAKEISDIKDVVVRLLSSALPPEARTFLESLTPDEFLTMLVAILHPDARTSATVDAVGDVYARTPQLVRDLVAKSLFVEAGGTTPLFVSLRKGQEHVAISWAVGRRARLLVVETRFNFVTLLNVFTLGLGFIVDAISGAWLNLYPTEVRWELGPLK
jgi:hypothetical protein